jgi:hypothetical protein
VYRTLSYTYVHFLVLLPYLIAQYTAMDHLKLFGEFIQNTVIAKPRQ